MGKKRSSIRLQTMLIILTAFLIVLTIGISGVVSFQMFQKIMVQKIAGSRVDVLSQVSEKVSSVKTSSELLSNLFYYNENLTRLYKESGFSDDEQQLIELNFQNIEQMAAVTSDSARLDFYYTFMMANGYTYCSDNGESLPQIADYSNTLWFLDVNREEEQWISTYEDFNGRNVISIARSLKDEDGQMIGLYLFCIYEENLSQIFENLVGDNAIYIVDSSGNIVSHTDKHLIGIRFYDMDVMGQMFQDESYNIIRKNSQEYLFSIYESRSLNWILVEEIPMVYLMDDVDQVRNGMIVTGAAVLLVGILVCILIAKRTTRPLKELVIALENVGKSEDNDQQFNVSGWREISQICDECNYMNQRIRALVRAIRESEKKKRSAEMGFMQSQMSPHFLYNTLFSIRCLVDMGDSIRAVSCIDSFTSILKYILSYEDEFVEVDKEIQFLKDYKDLQSQRYGDRFHLDITCDEAVEQKKILRLIVEPLVENSLFHGMSAEKDRINIQICFRLADNDLEIEVTDDGVGFTDENYSRLQEKIRSGHTSNMIGMNNIRERIKLTFGKKYGLRIDAAYEHGARVILRVPVID